MFELIKEFPAQLLKALQIGEQAQLNTRYDQGIKNVLVSGLGGSGIGGNLLAELLRNDLQVPVVVNKGYFLPAFANASTLLIVSSYSGNTEEAVSVVNEALSRKLKPICVTSGGRLEEIALANGLDLIKIPAGFPPRACLGYSATQLFFILHHYKLINADFKKAIGGTAEFLEKAQKVMMEESELLAAKLIRKVVIAYAEDKYESVALRLKQQINENSKMHCWYNVVPEVNHNELVGWREPHENLAVIFFRSDDEFNRNARRIRFKKDIIVKVSDHVYEIHAQGANTYEKHFYFILFGDWLSYYMAILQGYDPMEIDVLISLKDHMKSTID